MASVGREDMPGLKVGIFFVPYKYIALVLLMGQTTAIVLSIRYSRTQEGGRYLTTTAVCMAEFFKIFGSMGLLAYERGENPFASAGYVSSELTGNAMDAVKLSVPAVLYTIQNNLLFVALSNLNAATYQVTYQLKILTTALFSVILLGKALDFQKWGALVLLFFGVALVQMPDPDKEDKPEADMNQFVGLVSILSACCSSGFAGVYFEKILKGSKQSVWLRNVELGMFSFVLGLGGVFVTDGAKVMADGFFQNYNSMTWIVISLNAFVGLTVAVVIKYADNILKTFANAISILLTGFISFLVFADFHLSTYFLGGALVVILATFLYSIPLVKAAPPKTPLPP